MAVGTILSLKVIYTNYYVGLPGYETICTTFHTCSALLVSCDNYFPLFIFWTNLSFHPVTLCSLSCYIQRQYISRVYITMYISKSLTLRICDIWLLKLFIIIMFVLSGNWKNQWVIVGYYHHKTWIWAITGSDNGLSPVWWQACI